MDIQILGLGYTETTLEALAQAPLPEGWAYSVVDYLQPDSKVLVIAKETEAENRTAMRAAAKADTLDDAITILVERLNFEIRHNRLMKQIEQQAAEIERLKSYTDPRLFAAASCVLEYWDLHGEVCEETMDALNEAVDWWDKLPWKPGDGGVEEKHYYAIYDNYTGQVVGLADYIGDDDGNGLVTYMEITKEQYDETMAKWKV